MRREDTSRKNSTKTEEFIDWRNYHHRKYITPPPPEAEISSAPEPRIRNITTFDPEEASDQTIAGSSPQRRLYRQARHNRDIYSGYRADVDLPARLDMDIKIGVMRVIGGQLDMPSWLITKATSKLFSINLSKTGHPTPAVGFCLYTHLFNEATDAYENRTKTLFTRPSPGKGAVYYPSPDKQDNDTDFKRVADNLIDFYPTVTVRVLQSLLEKIRSGSIFKQETSSKDRYRLKLDRDTPPPPV